MCKTTSYDKLKCVKFIHSINIDIKYPPLSQAFNSTLQLLLSIISTFICIKQLHMNSCVFLIICSTTPSPYPIPTLAVEIFSHFCLLHYVFSSSSSSSLMFFKPAHKNKCKGLHSSFQGFPNPTVPRTHYLRFPDVNVHSNHLADW